MIAVHDHTLLEPILTLTKIRMSPLERIPLDDLARLRGDQWQRLLVLAGYHGVFERVATSLLQVHVVADHEVLGQIREQLIGIARRNMRMAGALCQCLRFLSQSGVFAVPFKGPVFNVEILGDVGLRSFCDLDILVAPNDVWLASQALIDNGYIPLCRLHEQQLKKLVQSDNELPHVHPDTGCCIDLQWELGGGYSKRPITIDAFDDKLITTTFYGLDIYTLCREDLAVYLAIHGMQHDWSTLDQVTCFTEVLLKSESFNWCRAWERASELGCSENFALGLQLAHNLYGLELQPNLEKNLRGAEKYAYLVEEIVINIMAQNPDKDYRGSRSRFSHTYYRLLPTILDRVTYLGRLVLRPTRYDWEVFALPACLAELYWLSRPLRLLYDLLCRLVLRTG